LWRFFYVRSEFKTTFNRSHCQNQPSSSSCSRPRCWALGGVAGMLAYALAAIHLAMTLVTDFPLGLVKLVPFRLHISCSVR